MIGQTRDDPPQICHLIFVLYGMSAEAIDLPREQERTLATFVAF